MGTHRARWVNTFLKPQLERRVDTKLLNISNFFFFFKPLPTWKKHKIAWERGNEMSWNCRIRLDPGEEKDQLWFSKG